MSVHIHLPSLLSPNDLPFPFLSSFPSSRFTNHRHSAKPLVRKTQKQKQNSSHFPIFSAAHQETTPTTIIPTSTSTRKQHVAICLRERLGFSYKDSLAIAQKLIPRRDALRTREYHVTGLLSFENADNVITFLQEHCGLTHSQVKKLISKHPSVLVSDIDKTLKPRIKLVQDLGFSTSDLAHVLSEHPRLYLEYDLGPTIQALRGILGSDDDKSVVRVFKHLNYGNATKLASTLIPNVAMLENEYGITRDKLIKFMTKSPQSLFRNTESLRDVLVRIEGKWGITRDSKKFLRAIHVFCANTDENIETKCQVFRRYGWSEVDILSLIKRFPDCLGLSQAVIKNKLDFYMKELGGIVMKTLTQNVKCSGAMDGQTPISCH